MAITVCSAAPGGRQWAGGMLVHPWSRGCWMIPSLSGGRVPAELVERTAEYAGRAWRA